MNRILAVLVVLAIMALSCQAAYTQLTEINFDYDVYNAQSSSDYNFLWVSKFSGYDFGIWDQSSEKFVILNQGSIANQIEYVSPKGNQGAYELNSTHVCFITLDLKNSMPLNGTVDDCAEIGRTAKWTAISSDGVYFDQIIAIVEVSRRTFKVIQYSKIDGEWIQWQDLSAITPSAPFIFDIVLSPNFKYQMINVNGGVTFALTRAQNSPTSNWTYVNSFNYTCLVCSDDCGIQLITNSINETYNVAVNFTPMMFEMYGIDHFDIPFGLKISSDGHTVIQNDPNIGNLAIVTIDIVSYSITVIQNITAGNGHILTYATPGSLEFITLMRSIDQRVLSYSNNRVDPVPLLPELSWSEAILPFSNIDGTCVNDLGDLGSWGVFGTNFFTLSPSGVMSFWLYNVITQMLVPVEVETTNMPFGNFSISQVWTGPSISYVIKGRNLTVNESSVDQLFFVIQPTINTRELITVVDTGYDLNSPNTQIWVQDEVSFLMLHNDTLTLFVCVRDVIIYQQCDAVELLNMNPLIEVFEGASCSEFFCIVITKTVFGPEVFDFTFFYVDEFNQASITASFQYESNFTIISNTESYTVDGLFIGVTVTSHGLIGCIYEFANNKRSPLAECFEFVHDWTESEITNGMKLDIQHTATFIHLLNTSLTLVYVTNEYYYGLRDLHVMRRPYNTIMFAGNGTTAISQTFVAFVSQGELCTIPIPTLYAMTEFWAPDNAAYPTFGSSISNDILHRSSVFVTDGGSNGAAWKNDNYFDSNQPELERFPGSTSGSTNWTMMGYDSSVISDDITYTYSLNKLNGSVYEINSATGGYTEFIATSYHFARLSDYTCFSDQINKRLGCIVNGTLLYAESSIPEIGDGVFGGNVIATYHGVLTTCQNCGINGSNFVEKFLLQVDGSHNLSSIGFIEMASSDGGCNQIRLSQHTLVSSDCARQTINIFINPGGTILEFPPLSLVATFDLPGVDTTNNFAMTSFDDENEDFEYFVFVQTDLNALQMKCSTTGCVIRTHQVVNGAHQKMGPSCLGTFLSSGDENVILTGLVHPPEQQDKRGLLVIQKNSYINKMLDMGSDQTKIRLILGPTSFDVNVQDFMISINGFYAAVLNFPSQIQAFTPQAIGSITAISREYDPLLCTTYNQYKALFESFGETLTFDYPCWLQLMIYQGNDCQNQLTGQLYPKFSLFGIEDVVSCSDLRRMYGFSGCAVSMPPPPGLSAKVPAGMISNFDQMVRTIGQMANQCG